MVDIVIVGSGILGTLIAATIHERFPEVRVVCFRLSDADRPSAESLRNQGWAQSGLRYLWFDSGLAAAKMFASRENLFRFVGIPSSHSAGVMQMDSLDEANFLRSIESGPFKALTHKLDAHEARRQLSSFWHPDGVCYAVPEYHLNIPQIMHIGRSEAIRRGVQFREVKRVEILDPHTRSGVLLDVDGVRISTDQVLFTAGCGNIPFMDKLGLPHGYTIQETPLLVVRGQPLTQVGILSDRKNGLSIASHQRCSTIENGCMIIGTEAKRAISGYHSAADRAVQREHADFIYDALERHLPYLRREPDGHTFTAGWEPIPPDGIHFQPHILRFPQSSDFRNILFAFPGRATLALDVARDVVAAMPRHVATSKKYASFPKHPIEVGEQWRNGINMHFHDYYRTFNDFQRGAV